MDENGVSEASLAQIEDGEDAALQFKLPEAPFVQLVLAAKEKVAPNRTQPAE